MAIGGERLEEICNSIVGSGGERVVDVREEGIARLPPEFFPQKLDDGLEPVISGNLVEVILHDRRISNSFESNNNF